MTGVGVGGMVTHPGVISGVGVGATVGVGVGVIVGLGVGVGVVITPSDVTVPAGLHCPE